MEENCIQPDGNHTKSVCVDHVWCLDCYKVFESYEDKQDHFDQLNCDDLHRTFREAAQSLRLRGRW